MSTISMKLSSIRKRVPHSYWGERIVAQLEYAFRLSNVKARKYDDLIENVIRMLDTKIVEEGAITKASALEGEAALSEMAAEAKRYSIICAAHAHIDMNWMWPWDETVAITLDTFRTMLDLMREYPEFRFSQSQASIYRIVEEYAPGMLEEIKSRIKEGSWEVTASHWVEADKNMPNGESLSRHILYTKRYLSKLLEIDPDTLNIDFEPDTFGHSLNVPEILANGGVAYYYHCRGYEGHHLYNWVAPSGNKVTVYREPIWYNATIEPTMAAYVPDFCSQHSLDTMLKVYGVGDHGGGPTRRDLERIRDMATWPVFPSIRFGTFRDFFACVGKIADSLPEVHGELNSVFTGCYSSQSRIKLANRVGEATLHEAETFGVLAALATGAPYAADKFEAAWRNVLFNQFHDIIPGSGVIETREHAMGLFQNTMALANTERSLALRKIASEIDTSAFIDNEEISCEISEGAGVGYGINRFKISQVERGSGKIRIFHLFNCSLKDREETVELTIWDWSGNREAIRFRDHKGRTIRHQLLNYGLNEYWGHHYMKVLIKAKVPACGYSTFVMDEADCECKLPFPGDPRTDKADEFILENQHIRAKFDPINGSIISLIDKKSGEETIDPNRPTGIFRFIEEDPSKGMSAWRVGRYMKVTDVHQNVKIHWVHREANVLRQTIRYEFKFGESSLKAEVSLEDDSSSLDFHVECDWHEVGGENLSIPQLSFHLPLSYECSSYQYDVPFGTIIRGEREMDVPANSWAFGIRPGQGGTSFMLMTRSKYGFRGTENSLSLTLIRGSYDPDPYPEIGKHRFQFAVALVDQAHATERIDYAYDYNHPIQVVSEAAHRGRLAAEGSFMELIEGSVSASAVKMAETHHGNCKVIVRLYETLGERALAAIKLFAAPKNAYWLDLNERELLDSQQSIRIEGRTVAFECLPWSVVNLCMEF